MIVGLCDNGGCAFCFTVQSIVSSIVPDGWGVNVIGEGICSGGKERDLGLLISYPDGYDSMASKVIKELTVMLRVIYVPTYVLQSNRGRRG